MGLWCDYNVRDSVLDDEGMLSDVRAFVIVGQAKKIKGNSERSHAGLRRSMSDPEKVSYT